MKNYIIGTLIVVIFVLLSLIYKNGEIQFFQNFPLLKNDVPEKTDIPLYIYVFFSKRNCHDCLSILKELDTLPPQFVTVGVVPKNELKNSDELRRIIGISFPLVSTSRFKKFIPWYGPSVMVVSPAREIILVLPVVPGEPGYLKRYLSALYLKLLPVFMEYKMSQSKNT